MSENTSIEWTTNTWNPWQGCRHVSPGCENCYMFMDKKRYGQDPETVIRSKPPTFDKPRRWHDPAFVFTCSWSDWFIQAADPWRREAWQIVRETPHLTYQILTKRDQLIRDRLPPDWGSGYPNVWLGVSVEDGDPRRLARIDTLRTTPAAVRFLSVEPLIAPAGALNLAGIGWVIVGGESGPKARPMDLDWAREVRDACTDQHVPFFLKQLGGRVHKRGGDQAVIDGRRWVQMPSRGDDE